MIEKGSVTTTGKNAPGIFAESDGGNNGGGGVVDVAVDGRVITTGAGSPGVELVSAALLGGVAFGADETVLVGAGGLIEADTPIDYVHGADAILDNGGTVMPTNGIAGFVFFSPGPGQINNSGLLDRQRR